MKPPTFLGVGESRRNKERLESTEVEKRKTPTRGFESFLQRKRKKRALQKIPSARSRVSTAVHEFGRTLKARKAPLHANPRQQRARKGKSAERVSPQSKAASRVFPTLGARKKRCAALPALGSEENRARAKRCFLLAKKPSRPFSFSSPRKQLSHRCNTSFLGHEKEPRLCFFPSLLKGKKALRSLLKGKKALRSLFQRRKLSARCFQLSKESNFTRWRGGLPPSPPCTRLRLPPSPHRPSGLSLPLPR